MTGYDPQLLATFLAVEQTGSFTRAAARLGIQQPTVSQHIRRLEEQVGRTLVLRDTHSVSLTADGEAMTGFARNILAASEQAAAYFRGSRHALDEARPDQAAAARRLPGAKPVPDRDSPGPAPGPAAVPQRLRLPRCQRPHRGRGRWHRNLGSRGQSGTGSAHQPRPRTPATRARHDRPGPADQPANGPAPGGTCPDRDRAGQRVADAHRLPR